MRKLAILLGLGSLLVAGIATAQIDPDSDMIGVYFDPGATIWCISPGPAGPTDAYLCLTNATATAGVSGWECSIIITEGVFVLDWGYSGAAINALSPPDFAVGLASPLPWEPSIVLMTMTVGLFNADPVDITITAQPIPSIEPDPYPLPAYAAGDDPGDLRPLGYSTGWNTESGEPNLAAVINGECTPTATDESTWGNVKNMYK
jgi:hypothetical protein